MAKLNEYTQVDYPEPHIGRTTKILKDHPEITKLFGYTPSTAIWTFGVVSFQILMAWVFKDSAWWALLLGSFFIGAYANHSLFAIIHDCAHNLAFKKSPPNKILSIFANTPIIFPCAIMFRGYHLLHHRYQGEFNYDADLPGPKESKFFGNSPIGKAAWLLFFFVIEGFVRPTRLKDVKLYDGWAFVNVIYELAFLTGIVFFLGWGGFAYLALSTIFCIGLHPVGARWIQEHFIVKEGQETYSYYGPLNKLSFNVGYHNEHHDFMGVPWSRLPKIRAIAPEYYNTLYYHTSWTGLFFRWIFDPKLDLRTRVVRMDHKEKAKMRMKTAEKRTQEFLNESKSGRFSGHAEPQPNP